MIVSELSLIVTWSEVNGSIVPSWYDIEYLSTSNGSKNTLVIPTVASKPACDVSVRELLDTDWFLICLWIIKLESDVSRFDIFFLGNFEKIPEFSRFKTLGTLILKVDEVVLFVDTVDPILKEFFLKLIYHLQVLLHHWVVSLHL